jgi:DNA-binding Lrp family transcriptional regulator
MMRAHQFTGPQLRAARRNPRLDQMDLKILSILQVAGRTTNLDLADRIGLSATPCLQRVKRLEGAGYITSYGAKLAIDRLCANVIVFTEVTLLNHGPEDFTRFEREIQRVPQVLSAFIMTGGYDYLLQIIASDMAHYQATMEELIKLDLGIAQYFSYVTIKQVKAFQGYPLEALMAAPRDVGAHDGDATAARK